MLCSLSRSSFGINYPWHCGKLGVPKSIQSLRRMAIHRPSWHWLDVAIGIVAAFRLIKGHPVPVPCAAAAASRGMVPALCNRHNPYLALLVVSADEGNAQSQRHCSAKGEILRPLQDKQQQRRTANACLGTKRVKARWLE